MLGRILVFIAGLVALALFVALLAPYFVDWTGFRQDFERRASLILGKKVIVHGEVSARIIPFPSVTMNDVRIGQDEKGQPLVTASQFAMDMELAPFLSGEARIFEMRIIDPKVHIALQKDGSLDWARTGNPSIPAKVVVLENVRVSGGELIFEDHQTGRTRHFSNLDFSASAKSLAGPWHFDGHGSVDGQTGSFVINTGSREDNGDLRVATHIVPDAFPVAVDLDGTLKLKDLHLNYEGDFSASHGVKKAGSVADARAKGKFELTNDRVRVPEYRMELGDPADPYVISGEATIDAGVKPQFLLTAQGQQIDMNSIGTSGEDAKRGRNQQELTPAQRMQAFIDLLADIPVPQMPGKATLTLPAIVSGPTSYRDISVEAEPDGAGWKINQASVELPGRTHVEANGVLNLGSDRSFAGTLTAASTQPSGLAGWLAGDVSPEIRNLASAGFSAQVKLTDQLQQFENLELAAGGAILKGRAERQVPNKGAPTLSVDLSGGDLDLDALRGLTSLLTGKDSADTFFAHTIAARLSLKTLAAEGILARNVETAFTLKDGQLAIDRFSVGDLAGAAFTISGSASGTLAEPQANLKGSFQTSDPTAFLALLKIRRPDDRLVGLLADNADFYKDTKFDFNLAAGGSDASPVSADATGTADGSAFTVKLGADDVGLSPGTDLTFNLTAENDSYATLFGQAGFAPLPAMTSGHGNLVVNIARKGKAPADIAMNFTTGSTGLNLKGTGDLSADHFLEGQYKLLLDSDDLGPFLMMEGYAVPRMVTGLPMSANAALDIKPDAFALSGISGKVDKEGFSGALSLSRATQSKLTGQLALDSVDAAWLAEFVAGPLEDENGAFSSKAIAQPSQGPFDVNIGVSAKSLWLGLPAPVTDFKGQLVYSGNAIALNDVAGTYGEGDVKGGFSLTAGDGQAFFRGRMAVKSADVRTLSWSYGESVPVFAGRADASLQLEASGKTMKQITDQLSGSGTLSFNGLDVNGLNSNALPGILDAAGKLTGDIDNHKVLPIAARVLGDGETHFGNLTVPLTVSSGKLRIQNFTADGGPLTVSLDAAAGITDSSLNANVRVSFKPGDDAVAGADPALGMKVTGTFNVPAIAMDVTELSNYLSLRAFERERRKAELLQSKLAEKQRLRRETFYFKSLADKREAVRIEAEKKAQFEAEQERLRAEKAAADAAAQIAPDAPGNVINPDALPMPAN